MKSRSLVASLAALCLGSVPLSSQIIYTQDFAYSGVAADRPAVTAYDWQLSFTDGSNNNVASVTAPGFSAGNPTGAVAEAQSPAGAFDGGTTGVAYMYFGTQNVQTAFMLFTSAAGSISQSTNNLAFDWWYGTQSTNGNVRLAVQIDDDWFVTTQSFSSTVATATADMETQGLNANVVFDPAAANWADLAFTPGDSFTVSSTFTARSTDLPAGDITAFGFYAYNPNDGSIAGTSIDSVQVIPEPSVIALIVGLAVLPALLIRRRLRR